MSIASIQSYQVLDSRGEPTIRVRMSSESGLVRQFDAPSGTSVSGLEAKAIFDGGASYAGHAVSESVDIINSIIGPKFIGYPLSHQEDFDSLITALDGTLDRSRLGTQTLTALSGAYFLLSCAEQKQPVWMVVADLLKTKPALPRLYANLVAGGAHAPGLDLQEFMIVPKTTSPSLATALIYDVRSTLQSIFQSLYGPAVQLSSEEGAMAPIGATSEVVLEAMQQLQAKFNNSYDIALDAAANHFFTNGTYTLARQTYDMQQLGGQYMAWDQKYPLLSVEDPFAEQDIEGLKYLAGQPSKKFFVVGDDSTATDAERIRVLAEQKLIGAVIIKPNQAGTMTDMFKAIRAAQSLGLKIIISHRSGETNDIMLADLAFGIGAFGIKLGAPARGERVAKYNRLIEIESDQGLLPQVTAPAPVATPAPAAPQQPIASSPAPAPLPQPPIAPAPPVTPVAPPQPPAIPQPVPAQAIHNTTLYPSPSANELHTPGAAPSPIVTPIQQVAPQQQAAPVRSAANSMPNSSQSAGSPAFNI